MVKDSIIWSYFTKKRDSEGNIISYVCKFCGMLYVNKNATRKQKHLLQNCPTCPQITKNIIKRNANHEISKEDEGSPVRLIPAQTETVSIGAPTTSKVFSIKQYLDSMPPDNQKKLNEKFAKAVYGSGAPLSMFNKAYWKDFFKELRPAWLKPSTYKLSNPLLDAEYFRIQDQINTKLSDAKVVGVQCDGWTNRRNEGIVNFIVTTPEPVFFETRDTKDNRHTGEYLGNLILEVIDKIGNQKVLAVITDNASAMVSGRKLIKEKYKHKSVYGCSVHSLNLLIGDIVAMQTLKNLLSQSKGIINDINPSHVLRAKFCKIQKQIKKEQQAKIKEQEARKREKEKEKIQEKEESQEERRDLKEKNQNVSLKLPGNTRWGSVIFCSESLLRNRIPLERLAITENVRQYLSTKTRNTILDDKFWCGLNFLYHLLIPVVKWITILEGNECHLSLVTVAFSEILQLCQHQLQESPLRLEEDENILQFIAKRRAFTLRPIHFAANLLHPKLNGANLTREEQLKGQQFIYERIEYVHGINTGLTTEIQKDFSEYRSSRGFYSKSFVKNTAQISDPITWWTGTFCNSELSYVAADILGMPATTAATERSFSAYGNVHSAKRNRLTTIRAGMLTYVAHNLRLLEAKTEYKKQKRLHFSLESCVERAAESNYSDDEELRNWSEEENFIENEDFEIVEADMFDSDVPV